MLIAYVIDNLLGCDVFHQISRILEECSFSAGVQKLPGKGSFNFKRISLLYKIWDNTLILNKNHLNVNDSLAISINPINFVNNVFAT